ncbi:MAG TPA: oligosaccharide flippase family protein [Chloroflexia bacterium]|nr:oligosaccharide flippase family protein [Chloroflexia bacterium]
MRGLLPFISRGIGWKLGSDLLGRVMQYILLWVAARSLGRAEFGDFTFALSTGYMLAQVADFGVQLFVQRELARLAVPAASSPPYFSDVHAAGKLVGGGMIIKAALSATALLLIFTLIWLEPVGNKVPLLLIGLSLVLSTGLDFLSYCFRALRRLRDEALVTLAARAANLAVGVGLLVLGAGIAGLALASNLAMGLALILAYRRLSTYVRPVWRIDTAFWWRSARQPAAVGIGIVFSIISFRVDNLLIPPFLGREALGDYNLAYKLFEPSLLVPSALLAALFPLLAQAGGLASRAGAQDGAQWGFRPLLGHAMGWLFGFGILATASLYIVAVPLISLLYGQQYSQSAPILQVLALCCLPMYLNYGLTHVLIAVDRPQLYALFTFGALVVNVSANVALIPAIGTMGAAIATLAAEMALFALCSLSVVRLLPAFAPAPMPLAGSAAGRTLEGSP